MGNIDHLSKWFKDTGISKDSLLEQDIYENIQEWVCSHKDEIDVEYYELLTDSFIDFEEDPDPCILYETIFNLMNCIAPEGCYFGVHPGNGSLFGFFEYEDDPYTELEDPYYEPPF